MLNKRDSNPEVLAEIVRSEMVESRHRGFLLLLNADGSELFSLGNADALVFPRSSIKCIQASAMVRAGLSLEPRLLALVAASHSGSPMHQDGAVEILRQAGLTVDALQNAKDLPIGEVDRRNWGTQAPTSLAQNCSGKHAGMLATCVANDWPIENYLSPVHPLQVAIREELEELAEEKVALISVDGCGAPLFVNSLQAIARAIHKITISNDPVHQSVIEACRNFPEMVAGEGRLTTRKMREIPGLFMKEGAEAVNVGSMPDGRTFAYKIEDGSPRASAPILAAALKKLGITSIDEPVYIHGGGKVVGSIRANF